jgi:hypothetical protein
VEAPYNVQISNLTIATITLARTPREGEHLRRALAKLADLKLPVIVADGGSSKEFLRSVGEIGLTIEKSRQDGLVGQVKTALRTGLRQFPEKPFILYTEPDKYPFFEVRLTKFLSAVRPHRKLAVALPSRDARSFRTFPKGQQWTECFMNEAAELILGAKADYCYGPLLLSRRAAELSLDAPDDSGWGWRFWVMGKAARDGLQLEPVNMYLPCPKEQRRENSPSDRLYRLKQLRQNLEGLTSGSTKNLPG